jgi:hypothetical protein
VATEPTNVGPRYASRVLRPGALTVETVYRRYHWDVLGGSWHHQDFEVLEAPYRREGAKLLAVTVTPVGQNAPRTEYLGDLGVVPGAGGKTTNLSYIVIKSQPRR